MPIRLPARSAGHYTLDLLIANGVTRVLMHAFDGKASHAQRGADAGYLFSVSPSVIRSDQKHKLVRRPPLECLCLESDSPVLGPDRQARNEPANLVHSRHFIARAHGVSGEPVEEITDLNAAGLFPQVRRKAAGPV